jgi:hypothetical protein
VRTSVLQWMVARTARRALGVNSVERSRMPAASMKRKGSEHAKTTKANPLLI